MAYYSGQASSYEELLNVLVNACVEQGWAWSDGILNKGKAFVKVYVSDSLTSIQGPGLILQGGTGKSGVNLINPSMCEPRLGGMHNGTNAPNPTFPVDFEIFIFHDPDEVYLLIKFDVERFYYLAFGISDISLPGTGLWLSATTRKGFRNSNSNSQIGFYIGIDTGGVSTSSYYVGSGFFWETLRPSAEYCYDTIHTGYGNGWSGSGSSNTSVAENLNACAGLGSLISNSPNNWNSEAVLLPINISLTVDEKKVKFLGGIRNARYLRIDHYEPGQIIVLGYEKWMVFPFHKKKSSVRDGGASIDHSGTFGWAIRYDGP